MHSTFIFTDKDLDSVNLANYLKLYGDIHLISVQSPGSAAEVESIVHSTSVVTPLLAVPASSGMEFYSGTYSVNAALRPIMSRDNDFERGRNAIILTGFLVLAALVLAPELFRYAAYLPFLGFLGLVGLTGGCVACQGGSGTFSAISPTLGALFIAAGALLFTFMKIRKVWYGIAFTAAAAAFPIVQAVALVYDPRFCPACLIMTFTAGAYLASGLFLFLRPETPLLRTPLLVRPLAAALLVTLITRGVFAITGTVVYGEPATHTMQSLVGHKLGEYVKKRPAPPHAGIYLVTVEGCHECEAAKAYLTAHHMPFSVLLTSVSPMDGCFYLPHISFPVPLILVSNGRDQIIYQRNGWTSPQGAEALLQELASALKRSQQ